MVTKLKEEFILSLTQMPFEMLLIFRITHTYACGLQEGLFTFAIVMRECT